MRVGIDFGTTNSGVATYDGTTVRLLSIDQAAGAPKVLRTVLYMTRDGHWYIGREAIETYYQQNIGRTRRFVRKHVGEIQVTVADIGTYVENVYAFVDEREPGRFMHSLKSFLASSYDGTAIFGKYYTLEDLIGTYLRVVRERAQTQVGTSIDSVLLGRPVHFAGARNEADDSRAEMRLRRAAELAGFIRVDFELEPVSAALSYMLRSPVRQNLLVFDFGGGTLDLTVITGGGGCLPVVLATGGVDIAGDRFDRRIVEHSMLYHFGLGTTWDRGRLPFPSHIFDDLLDVEGIDRMNNLETLSFIRRVKNDCSHPLRVYALESLIANNYGYALYDAVEQGKRQLSQEYFVAIGFKGKMIDIWQPLTRGQFTAMIGEEIRTIESCIVDTVKRSGLSPHTIDAVIRTGGSSEIPCFIDMLERIFGPEKVKVEDVFSGVSAGLGIRAYELDRGD